MKRYLIVLLSFFLVGCATYYNPVTEKEEYTIYSEEEEIELGVAIDNKLQKENKILETPAYIKIIADKVGKKSDRPNLNYTVKVIENEEINAFATPGGFIYLYTGLLDKIESNDEIANIIGHEMGHICARDGINQMQKSLLYSIPASIILQNRSAAIQKAVDTAFTLTMLKYSRDQELRADKLGVTYAYKANYNPEGMISFFKKLQDIEEKKSTPNITFLASHPDIANRIENVEKVIKNLK
ncbi:MAG: M48 family metalloprotease [Elusimicrobia bacterium]|nr:M48 family metalloprotease [Elusimicrobiota bacterium]